MAMARYSGTVFDTNNVLLPGALVLVQKSYDGSAADLTDDSGGTMKNPLTANVLGAFSFNVPDGVYDLTYSFGGRTIRIYNAQAIGDILIGLPPSPDSAGKYLAWDAAGNPIASVGTGADAGLRADVASSLGTLLIGDDEDGTLLNRLRKLQPRQPSTPYTELLAGDDRGWRDALWEWWDPNQTANAVNRPRIRPVGGDTTYWGLNTAPEPSDHVGPLWMIETMHSLAVARAQAGDTYARNIVALQWAHIKTSVGLTAIADATTWVNAQDDASWKALYLAQVSEVLGDQDAINALELLIPAALDRFKDTTVAQVDGGDGVLYSPLGCQYELSGYDAGVSTTYEVPMMLAALDVWQRSRRAGFLNYAMAGSDWLDASFRQTKAGKAGLISQGIVLDPSVNGSAPRGTPINGNFVPEAGGLVNGFSHTPVPGGTPYLLGGNIETALLNARLWRLTGQNKFLSRALAIVVALGQPDTAGGMIVTQNVTVPGVYLQSDTWVETVLLVPFVREVLNLPGADPDRACQIAIAATARSILNIYPLTAPPYYYYGADWWGSFVSLGSFGLLNGFRTFQAKFDANPTGGVQAGSAQMMTTCNSLMMVQAAALLSSWGADEAEGDVVPSATGPTIVDQIFTDIENLQAKVYLDLYVSDYIAVAANPLAGINAAVAAWNAGSWDRLVFPDAGINISGAVTPITKAGAITSSGTTYLYQNTNDVPATMTLDSASPFEWDGVHLSSAQATPAAGTTGLVLKCSVSGAYNAYSTFKNFSIDGFYDGANFDAALWSVDDYAIVNFRRAGIVVDNVTQPDAGDSNLGRGSFSTTTAADGSVYQSGIRQRGSGGLKMIGAKFNNGLDYGYLLSLRNGVNTSILLAEGCSFENHRKAALGFTHEGASGTFSLVTITGCEIALGPRMMHVFGARQFLSQVAVDAIVGANAASGSEPRINFDMDCVSGFTRGKGCAILANGATNDVKMGALSTKANILIPTGSGPYTQRYIDLGTSNYFEPKTIALPAQSFTGAGIASNTQFGSSGFYRALATLSWPETIDTTFPAEANIWDDIPAGGTALVSAMIGTLASTAGTISAVTFSAAPTLKVKGVLRAVPAT